MEVSPTPLVPEVAAPQKLLIPKIPPTQTAVRQEIIRKKKVKRRCLDPKKRRYWKTFHWKIRSGGCCDGISHTPCQSCGVTIYTVSTALYLTFLRGLVACLTISCLSYCISCNKTLALFYDRIDCSFPLKQHLVWLYPWKGYNINIEFISYHPLNPLKMWSYYTLSRKEMITLLS